MVMDTIDDKIGDSIKYLTFRKETMFYHLFLIMYHLLYGVGSSLESMRPEHISPARIANIKLVGERIESKTAPGAPYSH